MLNEATQIEVDSASHSESVMHLLILDDSEVDRKRLLRLCTDAGLTYEATEVSTIDEMRAALDSRDFDIVFIDYLLVGEDGLDAVRLLAGDPDQSAVSIMVAGEGRLDIAVEAMRQGCSDYLTKSTLSVEALQKAVASAFERRIMSLSLEQEREKRFNLEMAVRRYSQECSVEMRSILAATLRRVRRLRSHKVSIEYAAQLGDLEKGIDKLWDALPDFGKHSLDAIEGTGDEQRIGGK
ncbi:MAG: response regulator [Pseudomonadota bacterium]